MRARQDGRRERGISSGDLELPSLKTEGLVDRTKAGLRDLSSESKQKDPATSAALSVDEVVALAQVGYRPIGVVTGTAVARLGHNGECR